MAKRMWTKIAKTVRIIILKVIRESYGCKERYSKDYQNFEEYKEFLREGIK